MADIPAYGLGARLGDTIGQGLGGIGQGIGAGIQKRTEDILTELAQRKALDMRIQALKPLFPGASPEQLGGLLSLPGKLPEAAISGGYGQQVPKTGLEVLQQMPFTPEQKAALQLMPADQREAILHRLQQGPSVQAQVDKTQPMNIAQAIQRGGLSGAQASLSKEAGIERRHQENLAFKKAESEWDKQKFALQETKDIRHGAVDRIKEIDDKLKLYDVLEAANESGTLIQGKKRQFLERLGLEQFFTNPATELAQKEANSLVLDASSAFKSARGASNFQTQRFELTLPTLRNTQEGTRAILKVKRNSDLAEKEYRKSLVDIADDALKLGKPIPLNLDSLALQKSEGIRQALAKQANQAVEKAIKASMKVGTQLEELPTMGVDVGTQVRDSVTGQTLEFTGDPENPWMPI